MSQSTGRYCGVPLNSRDIHLRTCRMNSINHEKPEALKFWFQDLSKQSHIQTAPAYLRSVCKKPYETACWRSHACGCVTSSAGKERKMRLQHRNTSCRILLCRSSKNTAICCKPQRRGENNTFKLTSSWTTHTLSRLL